MSGLIDDLREIRSTAARIAVAGRHSWQIIELCDKIKGLVEHAEGLAAPAPEIERPAQKPRVLPTASDRRNAGPTG